MNVVNNNIMMMMIIIIYIIIIISQSVIQVIYRQDDVMNKFVQNIMALPFLLAN